MNEYLELTSEELLLVYGGTSAGGGSDGGGGDGGGSAGVDACNVLCTALGVFTGQTVWDCTQGCAPNATEPPHGGGSGAEGSSGHDGGSYDPGYSGGT